MARTGVQIMKDLLAEPSYLVREKMILDAVKDGEVPSWFFQFRPVRLSTVVDGVPHELEIMVSPDYVSLGNDEDYFRVPMFPATAQAVADELGTVLPSKRLVDVIYVMSNAKLIPIKLGNAGNPLDTSLHEVAIQQQMKASGYPAGIFVAGHKKDIVVGPNLDGSKVAIYGWHDSTVPLPDSDPDKRKIKSELPGVSLDAKRIQDYSTIHSAQFKDYSHGTRLIKRTARLDGKSVDLEKVFADPKLSILVSDQGAFSPRFPNKKAGGYVSSLVEKTTDTFDPLSIAQKALSSLGIDMRRGATSSLDEPSRKTDAGSQEPLYKNPTVIAAGAATVLGVAAVVYYRARKD